MAHELEFTAASFLRIATLEARRGRDDPGQQFATVNKIIGELKDVHKERRDECAPLWRTNDTLARERYASFRPKITELQREKRDALDSELQKVSAKLSSELKDGSFSWGLSLGALVRARQTYVVGAEPVRFFAMKQLEINLRNAHRLAAPNRNRLIAQLRDSIEGKLPRYVLRTDVSSFYESIPHTQLLQTLSDTGGLSTTSLGLIRILLQEWRALTSRDIGLPTGVGLSAYLGEVYARRIDESLSGDSAALFYGRYVDDILLVSRTAEDRDSLATALEAATRRLGLTLNVTKTRSFNPATWSSAVGKDPFDLPDPIEFLGYALTKQSGQVTVDMSTPTVDRYKARLDLSFDRWAMTATPNSGHDGLLLDRVRFLAGNTKLVNSKGRAVTGIYFNYPQLSSNAPCLVSLDAHLTLLVGAHSSKMAHPLLERLQRASFIRGFAERTFHRFRPPDLERLVAVWHG
jgi:hypothetical protein